MECRLSNAQIITMVNQSTGKFKGKRRGAIESLKKKHGNDVKCGKTMVTKTRLNLDSYLIGRDGGGSSFLDQSRRELDLYQNNPGFRLLQKQWKTGLKLLNYWLFFYI